MAANISPIFVNVLRQSFVTTGTSANTLFDGTGSVATVFTAGATNGSKVETISLEHMGSNVATVVRFFINNGSSNAVATNNALIAEVALATNTASQSSASTGVVINPNIYLPPNYKLNCTIGTAVASGVMVSAQGGDY